MSSDLSTLPLADDVRDAVSRWRDWLRDEKHERAAERIDGPGIAGKKQAGRGEDAPPGAFGDRLAVVEHARNARDRNTGAGRDIFDTSQARALIPASLVRTPPRDRGRRG